MTVRRAAIRFTSALLSAAALAGAAHAHPGHGAPDMHGHGLLEILALAGAIAIAVWRFRGRR